MEKFETAVLLESLKQVSPVSTFLLDRYFPTSTGKDVFRTKSVIVEYKKGTKSAAPFIAPRSNGVAMERAGHYMREYTPPMIGIRRATTLDTLEERGFGEALYSDLTPQEREKTLLLEDMTDIQDALTRKKEVMASEVIFRNRLTVKEHGEDGKPTGQEWELRFYDGESNPSVYTPVADWDTTKEGGKQILADLKAMVKMLSKRGLPATDVIMSDDVADVILSNEWFLELLDNRRFELGDLKPQELPNGVTAIGPLKVGGRSLNLYSYDEEYYDEESKEFKTYIPKGHIALLAPACGHTVYGGISQMEEDRHFHTYAGVNVPRYFADIRNNSTEVIVRSAPLMLPHQESPWVTACVISGDTEQEEPDEPKTPPEGGQGGDGDE